MSTVPAPFAAAEALVGVGPAPTPTQRRERLRALLSSSTLVLPGVTDALGVRLVERAGFDAAYLTGAGLATLAGGLQSHRPELVDGVGIIVGIDRFMSEARAVTNFAGNAVATLLIGHWTGGIDMDRVRTVLGGGDPFDEATMLDPDGGHGEAPEEQERQLEGSTR